MHGHHRFNAASYVAKSSILSASFRRSSTPVRLQASSCARTLEDVSAVLTLARSLVRYHHAPCSHDPAHCVATSTVSSFQREPSAHTPRHIEKEEGTWEDAVAGSHMRGSSAWLRTATSSPLPSVAGMHFRLALVSACASRVGPGGLVSAHSPLRTAQRFASAAGRRPTYSEISESLAVLGFGNMNYDDKELKKKYRELVKKNHPDAGGDEKAMARIAVAYERLSGLSKREKEEFKRQQNAFSGNMRAGAYANPYRDHRYAHQNRGAGGGFTQETPSGFGSQYYQQDSYPGHGAAGAQNSAYWNYYHRMQQEAGKGNGQGFAENPFTSKNPFSFYAQAQRMRFMSPGTLFIQGLVLYLFLSTLFLFAYRSVRDYMHEDGWKMSDSLARHEQMQELHRLRQEMKEKAELYRDMQQQQQAAGDGRNPGHAFFYDTRVPHELRNPHVGETAEQRALEYARQRRLQMMEEQRRLGTAANVGGATSDKELNSNLLNGGNSIAHLPELKGWPRISEQEGRIIKRAQDPPGVVFFEPRQVDARARQIFNRMRSNERAASEALSATPATSANGSGNSSNVTDARNGRPIGVPVLSPAAAAGVGGAGDGAGAPPLPEANVGSVFAAQVNNNADARAAMNTIFGAIREARARNSE